ncbi:hypothetical protein CHO01_22080 [Cellulomonas hominis]|uniref:Putative ribosomally synthesized peptide with SipW-like signal peptide n=1 Tax=Cellulomonas hominis TaxID=156981 RepID=A0A511FD10_9CELL|nr:TasA family protein [Cellulomonas hominis]MBB5474668.1 putative ribosomally synthesized peptide with SipW-like signal peptide [Cellulomonas hominis]NKY05793.1 hypothetical protein [Cellulomonas hominis]GEL47092.1 hypothetical protein CHO01_22080 [Cellulomonas hominis]
MSTNPEQPNRRRRLGALLVAGVAIAAIGVQGANSLFTDQEVVSDNTFAAGTFDLTAAQPGEKIAIPNMLPGDSETFTVDVGNGGSLELRYALTGGFIAVTEGGDNLGDVLNLEVADSSGTSLFSGTANAASAPLIGDTTAVGPNGGRILAGGATEALTITVTYPEDADNSYAGTDAELVLTFDAEQTANNA